MILYDNTDGVFLFVFFNGNPYKLQNEDPPGNLGPVCRRLLAWPFGSCYILGKIGVRNSWTGTYRRSFGPRRNNYNRGRIGGLIWLALD